MFYAGTIANKEALFEDMQADVLEQSLLIWFEVCCHFMLLFF